MNQDVSILELWLRFVLAPISDIEWSDYKRDCGVTAWNENPRKAQSQFQRNYMGRGVSWTGYVVRVNMEEDDPMAIAFHAVSLLIKMDEEHEQEMHGADVGLSMSERVERKFNKEIDGLRRGDLVQFNSTL